jgi:transcriptional regulator with XRE-family HTH domain
MSGDTAFETVGERLRRLRSAKGLSQRELASPGVSYAYISRIEAGARTPSVKALRLLAKKLGVSVDYLETGRDLPEAHERELRLADAELRLRLGDDAVQVERELQDILSEAREAGDQAAESRALLALGLVSSQAGRALEAVERLEAAIADERVSPVLRPDVYGTLAQSYVALGAPDRAVSLLEHCLADVATRAPDDVHAHVRFATFLSYALTDAGDYQRAAEVVTEALARADGDADAYTRVRLYWSMSRLAGIEGQMAESLEYIRRAITLLETTEDTLTLARAHLLAANIEFGQGEKPSARRHVKLAEGLLGSPAEKLDVGMVRILQAHLEDEPGRAVEIAREAVDLVGEYNPAERGAAMWALAGGLLRQGKTDAASDAYGVAVDLLAVHGRRTDAAVACREWADLLLEAGRAEQAARVSSRAESLSAVSSS